MAVAAALARAPAVRSTSPTPTVAPSPRPSTTPSPRAVSGPPTVRLSPTRGAVPGELPEEVRTVLNAPGGGVPLLADIRATLERSLDMPLAPVRVHTDQRARTAVGLLGARAFTYGTHVFLGAREQPTDLALMAHEVTHVIQQQGAPVLRMAGGRSAADSFEREAERTAAAVQQGQTVTVQGRTGGARIQGLGLSDILDGLANLAANVPGYTLLTLIIGRNPINMRAVERNAVNLLRGFIGLIPGGELLFQVLQSYGIVERIGNWISAQTATLGLNFQTVRNAFTEFTDSLGWSDIFSPGDVWNRARSIFTPLIARIENFVGGLISQAITWLKETFMEPLSNFCREVPGYGLVTVMLGRDPFTNASVPRTALTVVRAFAEFIPGGTEKVNQLVESGALERAYAWFQQETAARNLTWARVVGTFTQIWNSLQLADVLHPIDTLQRVVGVARPLMTDLVSFAGAALMKLLELIYEAVMGAVGRRILAILTRARATFTTIIQDPVRFLRHLMSAVGQGVRQFMNNILTHLRNGVIAWLTGPVARAGIQMPEQWDLRGIVWFVLQILGLTWPRVREKLVRLMGERVVAGLEAGFQLLQEIRERGLVQALRDRVTEFFGNLREAALGAIRSFIQQRLVMAGITQLLSLLNPVGAVIQAIIKTYETIQFFIQKINEILDVVESIVNSIAEIAAGAIGTAANFVERTMARTIPVVLDFLARFVGLGNVGEQVQTTIRNIQARVDQMLDRAVDWIRRQAANLASRALGGDPNAPSSERVRNAAREAVPVVNRYAGRVIGGAILRPLLIPIKLRHRLTRLDVVPQGPLWSVVAAASPEYIVPTSARVDSAGGTGIAGLTTSIQYRSGTLSGTGNTVGTEMVANPLGPDHPAGQEPTGTNIWSSLLVTDPGQPNDRKYIRGHLLNHQVGGSGATQNLFPITAAANDSHESQFESRIKQWVNVERKWVYYRVQITIVNIGINPRGSIRNNKIDADIGCAAHVIDTSQPLGPSNRHNAITATIASRYRGAADITGVSGPSREIETSVSVRPEDLAASVALPSGHEYRLDVRIFDAIRSRLGNITEANIQSAIEGVNGIGPAIAATVLQAYHLSGSRGADIGGRLTLQGERSNLTRANSRADAIVSAVNSLT